MQLHEACLKTTVLQTIGDSAIVISCILTEKKVQKWYCMAILNRSTSFIDGQWDGEGKGMRMFLPAKEVFNQSLIFPNFLLFAYLQLIKKSTIFFFSQIITEKYMI